mgnify:CR=1 FL=1
MKEKNKQRTSQGVTLIALVVTIVILIILAAVSMNMVLGDQGIFKKAQEGANLMYDAEVNTQAGFNSITDEIDKITSGQGGGGTTPEEKSEIEQAKDSGEVFDTKTPIKDEHGNIIQIPGGFKVAEDSGDTVQQGIVIEDVNASGDEKVQGSQFVWIPVGTFIKDDKSTSNEIILGRYTFGDEATNGEPHLVQAAYTEENPENFKKHGETETINPYYTELSDYRVGVPSTGIGVGENATAKDLAGFVNSVRTNGGYYIARYEASFASGTSMDDYKAASKESEGYSEASMSYTEGTLWNFINQVDASKVAINTYSESSSVKSDLMNSYAWDTAIVYIQEATGKDYANQDGPSINNQLTDTGTKQDEVCKINDMASNVYEWTTEYTSNTVTSSAFPCTNRGGYYRSSGNTADRSYGAATYSPKYGRF